MKKLTFLVVLSCLIGISACCKKDSVEYQYYVVDFFTAHQDSEVKPAIFETITEQILVKEAYHLGATFETVTEQVLIKSAYTDWQISEQQDIHLVVNAETNTIGAISCFRFFDEADFIQIDVPAQYGSRTYQKVVVDGVGMERPAIYATRSYEKLISDTEIIERQGQRTLDRFEFRIPATMTIQEYLADQFAQQSIEQCEEGNSYRINN